MPLEKLPVEERTCKNCALQSSEDCALCYSPQHRAFIESGTSVRVRVEKHIAALEEQVREIEDIKAAREDVYNRLDSEIERAEKAERERDEALERLNELKAKRASGVDVINLLLEYMKGAELFGSRGRARWAGKPEPDADWDFILFTDDIAVHEQFRPLFEHLGEVREGVGCMWVHAPSRVDLNIMPKYMRGALMWAYAKQDQTGCTKQEMVDLLEQYKAKKGGA